MADGRFGPRVFLLAGCCDGCRVGAVSVVMDEASVAELVVRLDLDEPQSFAHLASLLRERRADQLEALDARSPLAGLSASMLHLRATRLNEIEVCEGALELLGESFEEPA